MNAELCFQLQLLVRQFVFTNAKRRKKGPDFIAESRYCVGSDCLADQTC